MVKKVQTKKLVFSFLIIASLLMISGLVSAVPGEDKTPPTTTINTTYLNDTWINGNVYLEFECTDKGTNGPPSKCNTTYIKVNEGEWESPIAILFEGSGIFNI